MTIVRSFVAFVRRDGLKHEARSVTTISQDQGISGSSRHPMLTVHFALHLCWWLFLDCASIETTTIDYSCANNIYSRARVTLPPNSQVGSSGPTFLSRLTDDRLQPYNTPLIRAILNSRRGDSIMPLAFNSSYGSLFEPLRVGKTFFRNDPRTLASATT